MQHGEDFAPHAEVAGDDELDARMALPRFFQRMRQFHLDVACGVQDEGDGDDLLRALGGAVQAFVEQHLGVLDEADLDPPVRMLLSPLGGEVDGFLVTFATARTVADEGEGGFGVHAAFSGEVSVPALALRKRWPKVGS